jgi:hypothetical protein
MFRWQFIILLMVAILAPIHLAQAYDYNANMQEMAYLSTNYGAYVAPWYDPDSGNYFALMAQWDRWE